MPPDLTQRKATLDDLPRIIELLFEDELGQKRELKFTQEEDCYTKAFDLIDSDLNQYLMVVENRDNIIATCHLTMIPSLTFKGSLRMQIEAVRVAANHRGQKIGRWMMDQAILYAQKHGAKIVQLTTNKERLKAKSFYEAIGFKATHEGMKLHIDVNP